MKTCRNHLLAVLRGAVCASALVWAWGGLEAGTVFVDFATTTGGTGDGATPPDGWTYSSIGKSDGAAYFNARTDFMISPIFATCVTNVVLEYKCSAADNVERFLQIVPLTVTAEGTTVHESVAVSNEDPVTAKTTWTLDFDPGLCANAFRIGVTGAGNKGNWTVYSASITCMGSAATRVLDGPTGLEATHVTTNGFTVTWNAVAGASEYLVTVVTNVVVPAREGEPLWCETFPRVTQSTSGEYSMELLNALTDWTHWNGTGIFFCTTTGHVVQVGNSSNRGMLATGPLGLEGEGRVLKFSAWRNEGRNMPLEIVDDMGRTNLAIDVALGTTPEIYRVELPELSPGDGFVFHSTTNAQRGRVYLGEMRVLADDEPERTNAVTVVENQSTTDLSMSFGGLLPTVTYVQVAAVVAGTTNVSDVLAVDMSNPLSGVWRVSQFVGNVKDELCGWATNVTQRTSWENGETVQGFHAFMNGEEITAIGLDSGRATAAGLYASSTNIEKFSAHSLSLLASGEREVVLELRIVNDSPTRKTVSGAMIDFTAHQWTFPESDVRTLAAEWAVTDGTGWPREGDWHSGTNFNSVAELEEGKVHRAASQTIRTGRITVPVGGRLCFRWRAAKATGSPMFGVSDVRVRLESLKDPSFVIFR